MKKEVIFITLAVMGFMMASCDPTDGPGGDDTETSKNYWERSALTHLQLRGPVKTFKLLYSDTTYNLTSFDESGRILSQEYVGASNNNSINYTYNASGQLASIGEEFFEYGSHGKYIPRSSFHMNHAGLTPNLSAWFYGTESPTYFSFNADTLYMISSYSHGDMVYEDTVKMLYSGKYPVSYRSEEMSPTTGNTWGGFMTASYKANGMFNVYSEGFFGTGSDAYTSTRTTTYRADDEFMLVDQFVTVDAYANSDTTTYTQQFTYNTQKDIIEITEGEFIEEYSDYVYDANNNWTSRSYRYKNGPNWSEIRQDLREITYWE